MMTATLHNLMPDIYWSLSWFKTRTGLDFPCHRNQRYSNDTDTENALKKDGGIYSSQMLDALQRYMQRKKPNPNPNPNSMVGTCRFPDICELFPLVKTKDGKRLFSGAISDGEYQDFKKAFAEDHNPNSNSLSASLLAEL